MSTTTPTTDSTTAAVGAPTLSTRLVETAPSRVLVEGAGIARLVGFIGLFALVLGLFVVITNEVLSPRMIGKSGGYLFAVFGLALMLYHAARDGEQEIRRLYGMLAVLWLILGIGAAVIPGPVFSSAPAVTKTSGYNLIPAVGCGILSLLFAIPYARHETDPKYQTATALGMLGVGTFLAIGSLAVGLAKPDFLIGPGIILSLLGLGFLCAYMGQVDTSEGVGYQVAFALGVAGVAVALYAIGRAAVPPLLYEGPNALRSPTGELEAWAVVSRLLAVVVFLVLIGVAGLGSRLPLWLRSTLGAIGVAGVVILALASFQAHTLTSLPPPYLVPSGIILMGLGTVYLVVSLGICSDNQFVTLTRRELSSYFLSPIGYLVLGGMVVVQWVGYYMFISHLERQSPLQEPIVSDYFVNLFPVIALILEVPALTMRLVAEEKRTGSLEVLLTAPVNETPVVMSKFLATWVFFMISWLPSGLFLIALRVEVPEPFDYRPLLSFYVAFAAQGLAFVAMGLFFSALTRNQIIAAVLTFVGMLLMLLCYFLRADQSALGLMTILKTVFGRLSFVSIWVEASSGRLPLRDTFVFVSLAVLFLFLSVKVLEARKWN